MPKRKRLLDDYIRELPEFGPLENVPLELIVHEFRARRYASDPPTIAEYASRFPNHGDALLRELEQVALETQQHTPFDRVAGDTESLAGPPGNTLNAQAIGRYTILEKLGAGGFGVVYRARDPQLNRDVAIKVARLDRISSPRDVESYLAEAQNVAKLDHPGIVPVFDVGTTHDGLFYVVSKFIAGTDLKRRAAGLRWPPVEAVELVASVAEAIHHAHQRGLVHRDIKPANILLDEAHRPLVADFGLALRDDRPADAPGQFGTPAYMSPEQARGEGHRVDARSDVYSLGVVLYELLAGQRPYRARKLPELMEEITHGEIRPPRQLCDTIPKEVERICMKALAKRATDRYTTAIDLADDLRHWMAARKRKKSPLKTAPQGVVAASVAHAETPPSDRPSAREPAKIIPKGLRSYAAEDADFFLQLLPGPTDRDGLPESIRFWKARIEATDADTTFSIGVAYGPSGCGKSSLFKAGLVPRLDGNVVPVFVEAAHSETEQRLLRALRRRCPSLPETLDLATSLAEIRQGRHLQPGQKICLILDQFEQWLHANRQTQNSELARA